jgi:hypothetical protein
MKQELSLLDQAIKACQDTLETIKRQQEFNKVKSVCQECGDTLILPDEKKYGLCRGCASTESEVK